MTRFWLYITGLPVIFRNSRSAFNYKYGELDDGEAIIGNSDYVAVLFTPYGDRQFVVS